MTVTNIVGSLEQKINSVGKDITGSCDVTRQLGGRCRCRGCCQLADHLQSLFELNVGSGKQFFCLECRTQYKNKEATSLLLIIALVCSVSIYQKILTPEEIIHNKRCQTFSLTIFPISAINVFSHRVTFGAAHTESERHSRVAIPACMQYGSIIVLQCTIM